jgi:hypothetical protein
MSDDERIIEFPDDRLLGYLHVKEGDGPWEFHGRFKKEGGLLDDTENPGWRLLGEARASVGVPETGAILLEVLSEEARDLSPLLALNADDLAAIWLGNTFVNDDQLRHLSHLTGLRWIDVQNNGEITDAGIAHLVNLTSLQVFGAHWTRITGDSLKLLSNMPHLTYVDIWGCEGVPAAAVEEFEKAMPTCVVRTD